MAVTKESTVFQMDGSRFRFPLDGDPPASSVATLILLSRDFLIKVVTKLEIQSGFCKRAKFLCFFSNWSKDFTDIFPYQSANDSYKVPGIFIPETFPDMCLPLHLHYHISLSVRPDRKDFKHIKVTLENPQKQRMARNLKEFWETPRELRGNTRNN